jgi:alginate O-acetyltransferase complex protein AlgJ
MATRAARTRAVADVAITASLLTALALPAVGPLLGLGAGVAPNERRAKAPMPSLPRSREALWIFRKQFDAFVRDHFGFRSGLLRFYGRTYLAMGIRPSDAVKIVVGRDRWLYYSGDDQLTYVEGRNRFSDAALGVWARCLEERGRWLEKRGIRYLVVIAPGKPTVYPEHLPDWVRPSTSGTRLDQFVKAAKGLPNVEVLDLRGTLLEARRLARVYDATDTHWNDLGAYAAYVALIEHLARWFPNERPAPMSAFELDWRRSPGGDLAEMLGLDDRMTESVPFLVRRSASVVRNVDASAYASASRGPAIVTENARGGIRRAVIFRDSFADRLMPFLSEHFGRSVFLWTDEFPAGVVDREHPDVVIEEFAERLLSTIRPANLPPITDERPTRRSAR